MIGKPGLLFLLGIVVFTASAQKQTPLFHSREAINIEATGSIKSIKKNSNDSTFTAIRLKCENSPGNWITIPAEVRTRGNFRLRYCYFPPLKLKFSKKDIGSTVFEGNKSLKLVVPCRTSDDMNALVRREYLCYRFYETVSPYHFKTRLVNLKLTEVSAKKPHTYDLLAFMVEDNSNVARRCNGRVMGVKGLTAGAFDPRQALRHDFFQYMIGNADWSSVHQHNTNVLYADGKYITLSYDFDMSGFVNAFYARENPPNLGTGDVRERVYRGYCKTREAMEEIRKEYLEKETIIQSLVEEESSYFSAHELTDMHDYLNQFFKLLKNDRAFEIGILQTCRTEQ